MLQTNITIKDVAKQADVSVSTVSLTLGIELLKHGSVKNIRTE